MDTESPKPSMQLGPWPTCPRLKVARFAVKDATGRWFVPRWPAEPRKTSWWNPREASPDPTLASAYNKRFFIVTHDSLTLIAASLGGTIVAGVISAQPWGGGKSWQFAWQAVGTVAIFFGMNGIIRLLSGVLPANDLFYAAKILVANNRCGVCALKLDAGNHREQRVCDGCGAIWPPWGAASRFKCMICGVNLRLDVLSTQWRCVSCGFDHTPLVEAIRDSKLRTLLRFERCEHCGYDRRGLTNKYRDACPECGKPPSGTESHAFKKCFKCGYDRSGLADPVLDACPECGVSPAAFVREAAEIVAEADRGASPAQTPRGTD